MQGDEILFHSSELGNMLETQPSVHGVIETRNSIFSQQSDERAHEVWMGESCVRCVSLSWG